MKVKSDIRFPRFSLCADRFKLIATRVLSGIDRKPVGSWKSERVTRSQVIVFGILTLIFGECFASDLPPSPSLGPLFDRVALTLEKGEREEWAGPLFFKQQRDSEESWGLPPFVTRTRDSELDSTELDILYPLLTYDQFGPEKRWQIFQWLNFSGSTSIDESNKRRLTLFPFYFNQRSENPAHRYTAWVPFYGHLVNRFFRDDVRFVLLPLYVKSRKRDVFTENFAYPFFHLRYGGGVRGWQLWPLVGNESKGITQRTNHWGDVEDIPGHNKFFAAWPFFLRERVGIGSTNELRSTALLPVFSVERSRLRDSTAFPWPLGFRWTEDREKNYREWDAPWPFVVVARGPGKNGNRVWPLFSDMHTPTKSTGFYLWPIYKFTDIHATPFERDSFRVLFYLYSDIKDRNTDTGETLRRTLGWPLFSYRKDFQGRRRLQILAPLEPILPTSKSIERDYSPIWSIWRSEQNPRMGVSSQSFLWNLYRRDTTATSKKCSLLFGLFQYQTGPEGNRTRLFYIPLQRSKAVAERTGIRPTVPVQPEQLAPGRAESN